jgi:hypothetical protein
MLPDVWNSTTTASYGKSSALREDSQFAIAASAVNSSSRAEGGATRHDARDCVICGQVAAPAVLDSESIAQLLNQTHAGWSRPPVRQRRPFGSAIDDLTDGVSMRVSGARRS